MNKKIAFIIPTLRDGGAERVLSNMSINLDDNIDQRILVWDAEDIDYPYKGELVDLNLPYTKNLIVKFKHVVQRVVVVKKYKKKHNIQTSVSHLEGPNMVNILSKHKDNVIVCVHNFQSRERKGIKGNLYKFLMKKLYNKADTIACVSENIKIDLIDEFSLDENKIKVIYNPFDIKKIQAMAKEEIEDEYKDIFKDPVVINVGRLTNQKAQWNLIRAFTKVKEEIPNCKLVILGQGELENDLKDLVKKLNLEKSVHFLGFKTNPFKYINKSTVFALTSLYEGFPMCLAEAMACETSVISVDCKSGPREMLAPDSDIFKHTKELSFEEYGVLAPEFNVLQSEINTSKIGETEEIFAKGIVRLIQDDKLRNEYVNCGKKRVNTFDVVEILKQWEEIF